MSSSYILIVQESQQRENQPLRWSHGRNVSLEKESPRKCERLWLSRVTCMGENATQSACLPSLPLLHWIHPQGHIHWRGHSRSNFLEPPCHKLRSSTFLWFPFWNPRGYLPKCVVSQTWFSSWLFLRDLWKAPRRWKVCSNKQDFFCNHTTFFLFIQRCDK